MSDYPKMTIAQLKVELGKRGLEKTGNKADLITRLKDNDDNDDVKAPNGESTSIFENEEEEKEAVKLLDEENEEEAEEEEDEETLLGGEEEMKEDVKEEVEEEEAAAEEPMEESTEVKVEKEEEEEKEKEEKMEEDKEKDEGEDEVEDEVEDKGEDKPEAEEEDKAEETEEKVEKDKEEEEEKVEMDEDDKEVKEDDKKDEEKPEKKKKGPKKWVAIMENEKSDKIIDELQKIKKLDSLKGRSREIFLSHEKHKVRVFPVEPSDMTNEAVQEALKLGINCIVKFHCNSADPAAGPRGILEITFQKRALLDEMVTKLTGFKESVQVVCDKQENEWRTEYRKSVDAPEGGTGQELEKMRLFAPSLPQTITEEEMWGYFPLAREIALVDAEPRKHAYLTFTSEESMKESVEELNKRGPQKDDFKFCRLLRLVDIVKLIGKRDFRQRGPRPRIQPGGPKPASRVGTSGGVKKPVRAGGMGNVTPRRPAPARARDSDIRRDTVNRRRDDRRSSYWEAPRRRSSGLENAFSQLQQPSPAINPQAHQGLQVLDSLLSTLGQMGGQPGTPAAQQQQPQSRIDNRARDSGAQKRGHSPNMAANKRQRQRQRPRRGSGRDYDGRDGSYQQGGTSYNSSYSAGAGGSSNYSRSDNYSNTYGRQEQQQGGNRLYSALDAVNKIARLRDQLTTRQQDSYGGMSGGSGSGYRQGSYY